jgi:hypothetical protein
MNPNLIFDLVELAVSLAHSHIESADITPTLVEIVQKAVQAYEDHTGESIDPRLIGVEAPL